MTFGLFVGILFGILLGCAIGLVVVMRGVKKSNDLGDSKGGYSNFSTTAKIHMLDSKDKVSKREYTFRIQQTPPRP